MTNKEKYKQAFSVLHASGNDSLEGMEMEKKKSAYLMKKTMIISFSIISILLVLICLYFELKLNWNWGIALDERVSIQEFRNMCGIDSMISAFLLGITTVVSFVNLLYIFSYLKNDDKIK